MVSPHQKANCKTYTSMSGETMPMLNQFIDYPLARTKDSIVRKQINPALYPINYTVIVVGIHFTTMIINWFMKAVITKREFSS